MVANDEKIFMTRDWLFQPPVHGADVRPRGSHWATLMLARDKHMSETAPQLRWELSPWLRRGGTFGGGWIPTGWCKASQWLLLVCAASSLLGSFRSDCPGDHRRCFFFRRSFRGGAVVHNNAPSMDSVNAFRRPSALSYGPKHCGHSCVW